MVSMALVWCALAAELGAREPLPRIEGITPMAGALRWRINGVEVWWQPVRAAAPISEVSRSLPHGWRVAPSSSAWQATRIDGTRHAVLSLSADARADPKGTLSVVDLQARHRHPPPPPLRLPRGAVIARVAETQDSTRDYVEVIAWSADTPSRISRALHRTAVRAGWHSVAASADRGAWYARGPETLAIVARRVGSRTMILLAALAERAP
jgi:hypothetical protein